MHYGSSTVKFAQIMRQKQRGGAVLAVDTWLGATDWWGDGRAYLPTCQPPGGSSRYWARPGAGVRSVTIGVRRSVATARSCSSRLRAGAIPLAATSTYLTARDCLPEAGKATVHMLYYSLGWPRTALTLATPSVDHKDSEAESCI